MHSKIKILGHPVHPMLITYPVAFYTATLVGFIIYAATNDQFWLDFTIATNLAAIVMATLAALPGFLDWLLGIPNRTQAKRTGLWHMLLNVATLTLFTITFAVYADNWRGPAADADLGIILSAIGVGMTLVAGYLGWMLVQTHHVGVILTREQEELEHGAKPEERRGGPAEPLPPPSLAPRPAGGVRAGRVTRGRAR